LRIRVIFLKDILPRYRAGEVWAVAGGYARNYLIPHGFATPATNDQLQRSTKIKAVAEVQRTKDVEVLQVFAEQISGRELTIRERVSDTGRLYGSVTAAMIASGLSELVGREIDRQFVLLSEPIKQIGDYEVPIRLHMEVAPSITVRVEAEGNVLQDRQSAVAAVVDDPGEGASIGEVDSQPEAASMIPEDVIEQDAENTSEATNS
jgi:large subunit ribosomal protein L9